jgi:hypothetical protein
MRLIAKGRKLKPSSRVLVRLPEKKTNSFYFSPEWRTFIASLIRARGRCCQDPLHDPRKPRDGQIFGDHIVELRDGGAALDAFNIMLRCGSCHSRKTKDRKRRYHAQNNRGTLAHPEDIQPSYIPLKLICGPPASGKSTFAKTHALPGALIIDLDEIASALSGQGFHDWDRRWLVPALGHRNQLLRAIAELSAEWPEAWFIVGEPRPSWRDFWQDKLRPIEVVVLATSPDICWHRIASDPGRQSRRADASAGVAMWWADWRARPGDVIIREGAEQGPKGTPSGGHENPSGLSACNRALPHAQENSSGDGGLIGTADFSGNQSGKPEQLSVTNTDVTETGSGEIDTEESE